MISFISHHLRASNSFSSSWPTAAVWNARANALFVGMSIATAFCLMNCLTKECSPENENCSWPTKGRDIRGIDGRSSLESSAQNFSKASPGPSSVHLRPSSLETLSNDRPMLSSWVVARILKISGDFARRSRVWPPETRRVRKGKLGG